MAGRSLREAIAEMFTVQRLQLSPSLYKCLDTTNVIESPQSGVQKKAHNLTRWRNIAVESKERQNELAPLRQACLLDSAYRARRLGYGALHRSS